MTDALSRHYPAVDLDALLNAPLDLGNGDGLDVATFDAATAMVGDPTEADSGSDAPSRPLTPPDGKIYTTGPSKHSGHALDTAAACLRRYALKYELKITDSRAKGVDPHDSRQPLVRGTLMHLALAQHYGQIMHRQRKRPVTGPDGVADPYETVEYQAAAWGPAWAAEVPLILDTYTAYRREYDGEQLQVLDVEHEIDFHPIFGFPHTRSADLIVRGIHGDTAILDHKTSGHWKSSKLEEEFAIDGQFLDYQLALRAKYGRRSPVDLWCKNGGAWVNVIVWPSGRGGKARFYRDEVPPAPFALRQRRQQLRLHNDRLVNLRESMVDPWEWPMAATNQVCRGGYGVCEALPYCRWGKMDGGT